jgi:hypothetical protein
MLRYMFALAVAAPFVIAPAYADEQCTKEPKEKWLKEDDMKKKVEAFGYKDFGKVLVSGTCYEIYGNNKDGKMVEVYFNPVDGSVHKEEIEHAKTKEMKSEKK